MSPLIAWGRSPAASSLATWGAFALSLACLGWLALCAQGAGEYKWDDHYMTYIYGRNLAEGQGLRYNAVDPAPTEGFSSLVHVAIVALGHHFGIDPLAVTRGASLVSFMLIPLLIGLPMARLLHVPRLTALAVTFTGQLLYFLTTATFVNLLLGMETVIFMGGVAALAGWSLGEMAPPASNRRSDFRRTIGGCLAMAVVALGRPEGPLLVVLTLGVVFLARGARLSGTGAGRGRTLAAAAAFAVAGLGSYLLWKQSYFGYLLPNPYYVKSHNAIMGMKGGGLPGWEFTKDFLGLIWPWVALALPLSLPARGARGTLAILFLATVPGAVAVAGYAKAIHEAAFQYRYEFPFLVHLQLLLSGLACLWTKRFRLLAPALALAAVAAVALVPKNRQVAGWSPTGLLRVKCGANKILLVAIGKDLEMTGLGQKATIALTAAGAIPYFSRFRAIDLVGLNDNYLSGRTRRTLVEVWSYVDGFKPDVLQSTLPPASLGIGIDRYDPVLEAPALQKTLSEDSKTGDQLPRHWDRAKRLEMARREMIYLRDQYTLGGAYCYDGGCLFLYVRKDSPYREHLLYTFKYLSKSMDRTTDLGPLYLNDPRGL